MGFQDREYLRDERPPGLRLSAPRSMVMTIVIINGVLFLVDLIFFSRPGPYQHALMYGMACSVETLTKPWLIWPLLTSGFSHSPNDPWHIAINMFVLWSFGTAVEPRLGRWEFLRFYLLAIVFGTLLFCARQLAMNGPDSPYFALGASGAVTAVTLLFALQNPNATVNLMMVFPVKAWVAALIMIVVNVLGAGGIYGPGGANIGYDVHLAGAAFAFAYFRFGWNFGRMIPGSLSDGLSSLRKSLRRKPKLRVHAPEVEEDHDRYADQDAEADRILIKIDREGVDSLTPRERKIMDDYSRRMQQKHR